MHAPRRVLDVQRAPALAGARVVLDVDVEGGGPELAGQACTEGVSGGCAVGSVGAGLLMQSRLVWKTQLVRAGTKLVERWGRICVIGEKRVGFVWIVFGEVLALREENRIGSGVDGNVEEGGGGKMAERCSCIATYIGLDTVLARMSTER